MQDVKDLALIIDSKVPLIALETHDEPAALQLLTRVAMQRKLGYFCWSITEGLNRLGFGGDFADASAAPADVLRQIKKQTSPALFALCDFHPFLTNQP
ncbi:MAG TPA: ATPase, partial [Spongiibacteraceae bacterium]|nr:ATPase [Spongiibacteraceae bacterium]